MDHLRQLQVQESANKAMKIDPKLNNGVPAPCLMSSRTKEQIAHNNS